MKIQSLAVIFAIIILPIVIILSYYIHAEVDTIALQTGLDTKLIDSTHDAMAAFEINTANEDLSSVADSLRSIIEASTNVFFNTLATNLGISNAGNAAVKSYIPAMLYTLYDGYYIFSPTRNPETLVYRGDDIIYVGDRGVTFTNAAEYVNKNKQNVKIGFYSFDETEYAKEKSDNITDHETEAERTSRHNTLYSQLEGAGVAYEFGQMLFKNQDGSYSTQIHTNHDLTSGEEVDATTNTKYRQEHVLKSYMPYSARYTGTGFDVTINYTLDNYITVMGIIGDVYYSKTGYLISNDTVKSASLTKVPTDEDPSTYTITDILGYNEITAENMVLSGNYDITITIDPILENGNHMSAGGGTTIDLTYTVPTDPATGAKMPQTYMQMREKLTKLYDELNKDSDEDGILDENPAVVAQIQELESRTANLNAICYYIKSQAFSNWVYNNLGNGTGGKSIQAGDISNEIASLNEGIYSTDSEFDIFHKFKEVAPDGTVTYKDNTIIFNNTQNPELEDSAFYTHKLEVIKNNVQYNLNLAISAYNKMLQVKNLQLPVIKDSEWLQILSRISVVTFMQGLPCGIKTYNNYAIASSTNNELTVIPQEIYYVEKSKFNMADTAVENAYHKIDCDKLVPLDASDATDYDYISFRSKEVKYDKVYDKETRFFTYDHRNLACYTCAIASNYEKDVYNAAGAKVRGYSENLIISLLPKIKQRAYYKAIGKERQTLYKTNALTDSNGFEQFYNNTATSFPDGVYAKTFSGGNFVEIATGASKRKLSEIREIEITLRDLKCDNDSEPTVSFTLRLNNSKEIAYNAVVNLDQKTPQTMMIPIHIADTDTLANTNLTKVELRKEVVTEDVKCNVLNVKLVYE